MSYDPYSDPLNPVRKGGPTKGDIHVNDPAEGVTEGTSEAQTWVSRWNPHGPSGGALDTDMDESEASN